MRAISRYSSAGLDASFAVLSDATRRGGLERAGLVITEKVGRVRTCKIGPRQLEEEMAWLESYRQLWGARFDELDKVVEELKRKDLADGRKKSVRTAPSPCWMARARRRTSG
nr:ArsR family transcriptional regulator [Corallococcus exercitus]